jgi:FixJ family two-component response regulator
METHSAYLEKKKVHVAVVDDDSSFEPVIVWGLRALGPKVSVLSGAAAFLQDTKPARADCLVLDACLGGMPGLHQRRRQSFLGGPTPVNSVTAHDEPQVREEVEHAGCSVYLCRPA